MPKWLAQEVELPEVNLKHFLHDEGEADVLLRHHGLETFMVRNVCGPCNNGWMSRLEGRAKPLLIELMNMRASLLQLSDEERTVLSAWAVKTAFMIASAQQSIGNLPWVLFRRLSQEPITAPAECFVLGAQLPFLPKGFLYACPGDVLSHDASPVSMRVGFSIHQLHFVVVLPILEARRIVRTSGVHLPLWPLDAEILVRFENFPTVADPGTLIGMLTGFVNAGILTRLEPRLQPDSIP